MSAIDALDRMIRLARDWVSDDLRDRDIADAFQNCVVLCRSDERNLAPAAGRHCLATFVSLVARMGVQIGLDIPNVPIAEPQPPLRGDDFTSALIELGSDLIPGSSVGRPMGRPDLVFFLGNTREVPSTSPAWRLVGGDWNGAISAEDPPGPWSWRGAWPIGAGVAAALGAAEVFKHVLRGLPLKDSYYLRHLAPAHGGAWDFGVCSTHTVDLEDLTIVSAGAIAQAALFVLLRVPEVRFSASASDNDITGLSNLNRNLLNRRSDLGRLKVDVLRDFERRAVVLAATPQRLSEEVLASRSSSRFLVGVDDIPARWNVQRASQRWLGVSGTSHFEVSSSSHAIGEPCAGCLHPHDERGTEPLPTVSFVSFWAGLGLAVRLLREIAGRPFEANQQHLWLTPLRTECVGQWGRAVFRDDCPVRCSGVRSAVRR